MSVDKKRSLGGEQGRLKVGPGNTYKSPRTSVLFRIQPQINFIGPTGDKYFRNYLISTTQLHLLKPIHYLKK